MRRQVLVAAVGAALLFAAVPACDQLFPSSVPTARASEGPEPVIDALEAAPTISSGGSQPVTLTALAHGPAGKALQYNWTATLGTLSATTGRSVTWKPTTADGAPEPGVGTITLVVTAGGYSATASTDVRVAGDGSASVNVAPAIYAPPGAGQPQVVGAGPGGAPGPSPSPSPAGSPAPSPSPTGCAATELAPIWAAPGTTFFVDGHGIPGSATVKVANQAATVQKVAASGLAALVPAALLVSSDPQPVVVSGCGPDPVKVGVLTVADTSDFGDPVKDAGQGLIGDVATIEPGTQQVPDLAKMQPVGSFLTAKLDQAEHAVRVGLPAPDGDLSTWLAIRFTGQLAVPAAGKTHFTLVAEDGAKLYIDGKLVVDDDTGTPQFTADGTADLTAGTHAIRVDYMQGARGVLALQLYWTPPGTATEVIVPATALAPGLGP